jgi:hypothetical protein
LTDLPRPWFLEEDRRGLDSKGRTAHLPSLRFEATNSPQREPLKVISPSPFRGRVAIGIAALTLAGCVGAGPSGPQTTYGYSQVVASGRWSEMGDYKSVSGDGRRTCHSQTLPEIRIVTQPAHGEVVVSLGQRAIGAPPGGPLYYCAGRRVVAKVVQYRSQSGYRGPDHLAFHVIFADGAEETYEKTLTVH